MNSTSYDPTDTIVDGLTAFAMAVDDRSVAEGGAQAYLPLVRTIRELMRPDDRCRLAFPSMIIRPDLRGGCLIIVLEDRVLVVYERGMFRRTTEALVIPITSITDVRRHTGTTPSTRGAALLTIAGRPAATIALTPRLAAATTDALRGVLASSR
jgi:hypothetical protein